MMVQREWPQVLPMLQVKSNPFSSTSKFLRCPVSPPQKNNDDSSSQKKKASWQKRRLLLTRASEAVGGPCPHWQPRAYKRLKLPLGSTMF